MQVRTRKLQPTGFRGERIRATGNGHQATVPWDYSISTVENHAHAAVTLLSALGIRDTVRETGYTPRGYVFEVDDT